MRLPDDDRLWLLFIGGSAVAVIAVLILLLNWLGR